MSSNQQPPNMLYPVANALASSNPFVETFNETRAPTADDVNYPIQKRWFDKSENKEWILVGFTTNTGQLQADWRRTSEPIEFIGGVGTAGTFPVSADNNGDILLESTDLSILITGSTSTLDFTTNGSVVTENFTVDAITAPGVNPVTPTAGNVVVGAAAVAAHDVPIETRSRALHQYKIEAQYASSNATTNAAKVGLASFSSAQFSVDANGFVTLAGGTTAPVLGLVPDAFTAPGTSPVIPNASGNIISTAGTVAAGTNPIRTRSLAANTIKTEVQFAQAIAATDATKVGLSNFNSTQFTVDANGFVSALTPLTQDLHWPKFIVGDTSNGANYSTIASAIAAASAGDTVALQPGTFTENLTLKNGVSICGLNPSGAAGSRTLIIGKMIDNGATVGCTISNLALRTNSDFILATTGAGSEIALWDCYIDATNNTAFSVGAGSTVRLYEAIGGLQTTGIALFSNAGAMSINDSNLTNSGASTTASSTSGAISITNSVLGFVFSTSSTGNYTIYNSVIGGAALNTAALTTAGTGTSNLYNCEFMSGTASAISIGAGTTVNAYYVNVQSSNTNAITGAGTLVYSDLSFTSSAKINTTTQTGGIGKGGLTQNPSAGFVGENASANANVAALTTATPANVTSVSLTAGIWDVSGMADFYSGGAVTGTRIKLGINSTSATFPGTDGVNQISSPTMPNAASDSGLSICPQRFVLTGTTTYYLVAEATFTVGAVGVQGVIKATRVG